MVGFGTTVIVYTAWFVHVPAVPNTVTVATVCKEVTGPVMVTGFVVKFDEPLKPVGKVHTYVPAPLAVKVVVLFDPLKFCEHKVVVPAMDTVGKPITDT